MPNTFTLTNGEISALNILMLDRIKRFENNYYPLIETIFEKRKNILFASFGLKWGTFKGWYKTTPYLENNDILVAGKEVRNNMGTLVKDFNEYECLIAVYNLINQNKESLKGLSLEEINQEENLKWAELAETLNNHKLMLTVENCQEKLELIYQFWDMQEKTNV
jgi:hypothetical protein